METFYYFELVFIALIVLDALSQGFSHAGIHQLMGWKQRLGNGLYLALIGAFVIFFSLIPDKAAIWMLVNRTFLDVILLAVAFLLFRYAIFPLIYNSCYNWGVSDTMKISLFYIGHTKKFDNFMVWLLRYSWFGKKFKPLVSHFMFWTQLFAFIFAEVILVWRLTDLDVF